MGEMGSAQRVTPPPPPTITCPPPRRGGCDHQGGKEGSPPSLRAVARLSSSREKLSQGVLGTGWVWTRLGCRGRQLWQSWAGRAMKLRASPRGGLGPQGLRGVPPTPSSHPRASPSPAVIRSPVLARELCFQHFAAVQARAPFLIH